MPVSGMFPIAGSSFFEQGFVDNQSGGLSEIAHNRAGRPCLISRAALLRRALEFPDLKPQTERRFSSRVCLVCRRRMGKLSSKSENNAC